MEDTESTEMATSEQISQVPLKRKAPQTGDTSIKSKRTDGIKFADNENDLDLQGDSISIPSFLETFLREQCTGFVIDTAFKLNFKIPHAMLVQNSDTSKKYVVKGPFFDEDGGYFERTWSLYPDNPSMQILGTDDSLTSEDHQAFHAWCLDVLRNQESIPNRAYTTENFASWYRKVSGKHEFATGGKYYITEYVDSCQYKPSNVPTSWKALLKVLVMRRILICADTNITNVVVGCDETNPGEEQRVLSTDLGISTTISASKPLKVFTAQRWNNQIVSQLREHMTTDREAAQAAIQEVIDILERSEVNDLICPKSLNAFKNAAMANDNDNWKNTVTTMLS